MNFDEFRVLIQPDVQNPGTWSISVENCSQDIFNISHGTVKPVVLPEEIKRLRNSTEPPDAAKLKQMGRNVLNSIMPTSALLGFQSCLKEAIKNDRGLRLVIEMRGNTSMINGLSLLDLPVEAAFNNQLDYLATNVKTPVSRGVITKIDQNTATVTLPIRILLVVSEPSDMPPVNAEDEKQAILEALKPLVDADAVKVDLCDPATLTQFDAKLQEGYHIVHFIGHGDYEIVGLDPNPQPHLYFEDGTANRRRKAVSAGEIFTFLRNGKVSLLVLTACSTAASSPNGTNYPTIAFESLAQNLVERQFGPLAAVAMQFDLETEAAKIFSRAFYAKLLSPGWSLDAAVSHARSVLFVEFGEGHRSWVNPTVYWRCKEGRVFEIADIVGGELTPEQRKELLQIDAVLDVFLTELENLSKEPPETRAAVAPLQAKWEKKIDELMMQRGLVLGDSIRLRGGKPEANGEIDCALMIRLRLAATLGDITVNVKHDLNDLSLIGNSSGADVEANSFFIQPNGADQNRILIQNTTKGATWEPGEYELAKLKFKLPSLTSKPLFHVQIENADVNKDGIKQSFSSLNAVIFGSL